MVSPSTCGGRLSRQKGLRGRLGLRGRPAFQAHRPRSQARPAPPACAERKERPACSLRASQEILEILGWTPQRAWKGIRDRTARTVRQDLMGQTAPWGQNLASQEIQDRQALQA